MIRYFGTHTSNFDSRTHPFFISMMKLMGALMTEIVNILLICKQTFIMDCVMNFIALGVISEIDNLYAGSIRKSRAS